MTDELDLGPQNDGEPTPAPPAEPPAPGAGPDGAETPKAPEKPGEEPEKPRKGGFQRKIERLEEQNRMLQEMLVGRGQQPPQEPSKPQEKPEPRAQDFDSHEDYQRAVREYDRQQIAAELRKDFDRQQREAEARRTAEQQARTATEKLQAAREKYPDLDDLLADCDAPLSQTMQQVMLDSPAGADLLYHLANHPDDAHRIAGLPPIAQVRELTLLEAKLGTKPTPKPSAAPPPPSTVKGAGVVTQNPHALKDDDEWYRARQAQRSTK